MVVDDWDKFVEEFGPLVYSSAWRILKHRQEAEDVAQDVFAFAWAHRKDPKHNMGGWLRHLAICRALDRVRRRGRISGLDEPSLIRAVVAPDALELAELEQAVRAAVAALPEQQANVFALRYFEEMTNREIADILSLTTSAVSSALHAARKLLANRLTPILEGK